jgi:transcriptional regulator with XRE-family HTH domain
LREAIERQGSIRGFQKTIAETGIRGASYQMIHWYLSGTKTPSLEFLREAARLLGVKEEWLITGAGPMSPAEEAFLGTPQDRFGRSGDQFVIAEAMNLGMPPAVEGLFRETVAQYAATFGDIDELGKEEVHELAQDIWWLCNLPRSLNGFRSGMPYSDLSHYLQAMLLGIRLALLPPNKEHSPVSEDSLIRKLRVFTSQSPVS